MSHLRDAWDDAARRRHAAREAEDLDAYLEADEEWQRTRVAYIQGINDAYVEYEQMPVADKGKKEKTQALVQKHGVKIEDLAFAVRKAKVEREDRDREEEAKGPPAELPEVVPEKVKQKLAEEKVDSVVRVIDNQPGEPFDESKVREVPLRRGRP